MLGWFIGVFEGTSVFLKELMEKAGNFYKWGDENTKKSKWTIKFEEENWRKR